MISNIGITYSGTRHSDTDVPQTDNMFEKILPALIRLIDIYLKISIKQDISLGFCVTII